MCPFPYFDSYDTWKMENKVFLTVTGPSWNASFSSDFAVRYGKYGELLESIKKSSSCEGVFQSNRLYGWEETVALADETGGCLVGKAILTRRTPLGLKEYRFEYEFQSSGPITYTDRTNLQEPP